MPTKKTADTGRVAKSPRRAATKRHRPRRMAVPKAWRDEEKKRLDKYIERWARRLLLEIDGEVRKLTEDEVQTMVHGSTRRRRTVKKRSARKSTKR